MGILKALLHALLDAGLGLLGLALMSVSGLILGGAMLMRAEDWSTVNGAIVGVALAGLAGGFWLYNRPNP